MCVSGRGLCPSGDIAKFTDIDVVLPQSPFKRSLWSANCYRFNCVYDVLYASLVHYRWPPNIIFAARVLLDRGNAQYWSQKLLADGEQGLHPWAVRRLREDAPKVYGALHQLFIRWNSAFALFKKSSSTTFLVDNNRAFGARCQRKGGAGDAKETFKSLHQKGPCPVYCAYQGDFYKFHGAILEKIYAFAAETPGLIDCNGPLERFCSVHVSCQNCVRRVEASARASWLRTMTHVDWSLSRKDGARGPWQDGKKRKRNHT
ncbi:uncharacterized protein CcaverHIS019_0110030 [Cutaneotrichosporon cavernicola]|uniref:Uncharacterized protein n=1 Tax=Cutaneotrichosporon cavernicola TaxID=279322 RepID=A0AA48I5M0_9TREE|nr:uncharacterized protein CcaverHIS019_0110030 [Cutaneotrichosporon cavernicola]BEI88285.1 hypothetical protein CcaverHIS019_0110030 [Cutaneotrichosporon cavernicola]BEI96057.1 hypothetical protein CcaverHIS631_0110060 [Cutaneotrichosporon cavernicola]